MRVRSALKEPKLREAARSVQKCGAYDENPAVSSKKNVISAKNPLTGKKGGDNIMANRETVDGKKTGDGLRESRRRCDAGRDRTR